MNSTTTLRACNTNPELLPRSRRVRSRLRLGLSTVALEHACEEEEQQQQQQVMSTSECLNMDSEQQHMRHAVQDAWKMPTASGSRWSDLQALDSAQSMFSGQVVLGRRRTRRARQLSDTTSSTAKSGNATAKDSQGNADMLMFVPGARRSSIFVASAAGRRGRAGTAPSAGSNRHRTSSSTSARVTNSEERLDEAEPLGAIAVPLLGTTRANALRTLLHLWHLHSEHNAANTQESARTHTLQGTRSTVFDNESARLLTAVEEATLGSIVQEHRKLLQYYQEQSSPQPPLIDPQALRLGQFQQSVNDAAAVYGTPPVRGRSNSPTESSTGKSSSSTGRRRFTRNPPADAEDAAAAAAGAAGATAAGAAAAAAASTRYSGDSMSSSDDVITASSSSSRTNRRKGRVGLHGEAVHGNTQWPPPLTQSDLAEIASMPRVWRALLPEFGPRAQQLLVGYNTRLVAHMLQYCRRSLIPTEDLLAAGLVGLKLAAARYDPSRKTRFSTVASSWILQHMQRTADVQQGSFRTPHRHAEMLRAVLHMYGADALKGIDNRPAVLQQVADQFKTKPLTVLRALRSVSSAAFAASLDAPSYSGAGSSRAGEDSTVPLAAMLTSTDLDEESEDGSSDGPGTGLAGAGSYMAAAGQPPAWMQQQHIQVVGPSNYAAASAAAAATEQQVETLLQVLQPRERTIMLMLYGSDADDLRKLALEAAEQEAKRPGRPRKHHPAAAGNSVAPKRMLDSKDFVSLSTVSRLVGMTVEGVRQVRSAAFKKLRLAAETMASSSSQGWDVLDIQTAATAVHAAAAASAGQAPGQATSQQAVAAAIQACPPRQRQLLRALQDYHAVNGVMPGCGVKHNGCNLGAWCSQLYFKHKKDQDSVSPKLLHAMALIAPGWVEGMAQRQSGNWHARLRHMVKKRRQDPGVQGSGA